MLVSWFVYALIFTWMKLNWIVLEIIIIIFFSVFLSREQPIFTTKAHVFQIDPETKKNWIPSSKSAVSISYYYDSTRNTYRIISVDGSKVSIMGNIWSDLNILSGLNMSKEGPRSTISYANICTALIHQKSKHINSGFDFLFHHKQKY